MIGYLGQELARWDHLPDGGAPEALFLPFFSDERPLRGAAGICDWRLCGRLSRLLSSGRVTGAWGETTLFPPGRRLPFARLVLFGLGPASSFDDAKAIEAAQRMMQVVIKMRLRRVAASLPGRSTGRVSARRSLEILQAELAKWATWDYGDGVPKGIEVLEVLVVESAAGQKESADLHRGR